jgi:hypothetical protein
MYSRRHEKLIGRLSGLGGVPRRGILQGVGALGLAGILRPTAVFAGSDNDDERLGPFGPWSTPVNLGPVVNSQFDEFHPGISKNGLSLYISSNRPGGVSGHNSDKFFEIWVSQRASRHAPWETPVNLDAFNSVPVVNSIGYNTSSPNFSPDGHFMFLNSPRPGGCGSADLYVSWRIDKRDDLGWQAPVNLGCTINSPYADNDADYFEDEETGIISLYFPSTRPGGPADPGNHDIYVSALGVGGTFGPAVLVPELSSRFDDGRTAIRRDGLEIFFASNRPGGVGGLDIWVSTRETTADPWSTPVNLGRPVNTEFDEGNPALSWDGTTMYFGSNRSGGFGGQDVYVTTRRSLRDHARDDEPSHRR